MYSITLIPQKPCNCSVNESCNASRSSVLPNNTPVKDRFESSNSFKEWGIYFSGSPDKDFFSAHPLIKDSVDRIVSGYSATIEHLNNLVLDKAFEPEDIKIINKRLSKELLKSSYNHPTEEKAKSLIKLGGVGTVIFDRCSSYASIVKADYSILGTGKKSAERKYNQVGKLMNKIFEIDVPELQLVAKRQAKKTLIEVLNSDVSPFAKLEALDIMQKQNLFNSKSDVEFVINEINNSKNEPEIVRSAIDLLPKALECFILSNKNLEPVNLKPLILSSLDTLKQLKHDPATFYKTKLVCTSTAIKILTNKNIPEIMRSQLIQGYYNS